MAELTHFDDRGQAHMVDVTGKPATARTAIAIGAVQMSAQTLHRLAAGDTAKGDALGIARIAGITGAKKTADLIPLCHSLPLSKVSIELALDEALPGVQIEATVKTTGQTGVEMEALTAVSTAALTIYDMLKAVDKTMVIQDIRLTFKDGGRSGTLRL